MAQHLQNDGQGATVSETRPLLPPPSTETQLGTTKPIASARRTSCSWSWIYVVLLGIGLAVVSDIGEDLYAAPRIQLFESVACTRYYELNDPSLVDPNASVPERFCKIDPVQSEVASVLGWQLFFDSIPAILLPIPYGYIADSYGRKWILVLALTGYTLSWASTLFFVGVLKLPLQYVWLSSLFLLVGGGPTTGTTLLTTVVADVVPPEFRSTVFFYRFCTDLIADLTVPPVTSVLMSRNIWIPLLLAVSFEGFSVLIALGLQETLPMTDSASCDDVCDYSEVPTSSEEPDEYSKPGSNWETWLWQTKNSFGFMTRDRTIPALVFTFLISKIGRQANNVLFQYVSKRYGWTLSQAGLLLSLRAGVNIALFTIILPSITTFAFSNTNAAAKDLWIGKVSIIYLTLGSFILFSSNTAVLMVVGLIISTLGAGFAPITRSLVTFLVESHHANQTSDIGRLYALISVMEGIGSLVAGPGMAWAFRLGMDWGRAWLGLPFGFATVLFAIVAVVVHSTRL